MITAKERLSLVRELFEACVELDSAKAAELQRDFFEHRCQGDESILTEVRDLLAIEIKQQALPKTGAFQAFSTDSLTAWDDRFWIGRQIDRFKILERLGAGGMGQVFKAIRTNADISQPIALKLIRTEHLDRQMAVRFAQEQKILASLTHPNIANFIDAGVDETGMPFVAMEYLDALDIVQYCKVHHLDVLARIDLIRQALSAISYAHRRLIVHCDLKPANVLVTKEGRVKLIDFGVAKALSEHRQTQTAARGFTAAYAAPEQLRLEPISTSADIYGLGAVMYEVLAGKPAFLSERNESDFELQRRILLVPPSALTLIARDAIVKTGLSKARIQELDCIAQKALRKEASERYLNAEDFDKDLAAFQELRPIQAKQSTNLYRMRKWVARNRFASALMLAGAVAGALLGGYIWTQSIKIRQEQIRAEQTIEFLQDAFAAADPVQATKGEVTAREVLQSFAARLQNLEQSDPLTFISLGTKLAEVQTSIGLNLEASELAEKVRLKAEARSYRELAEHALRTELIALIFNANVQRADEIWKQQNASDLVLKFPELNLVKGAILDKRDEMPEAIKAFETTIKTVSADPNHFIFLSAHWRLADAYQQVGQAQQALALLNALEAQLEKQFHQNHPSILRNRTVIIDLLARDQKFDEAIALSPPLIAQLTQVYGESSAVTAKVLVSYAGALLYSGKYEQSLPVYSSALRALSDTLGANNADTLKTRFNYAQSLLRVANKAQQEQGLIELQQCVLGAETVPEQLELASYFRLEHAKALQMTSNSEMLIRALTSGFTGAHVSVLEGENRNEYLALLKSLQKTCSAQQQNGCAELQRTIDYF
jgi:eukaryotic-like serine/threonine-protein kinase